MQRFDVNMVHVKATFWCYFDHFQFANADLAEVALKDIWATQNSHVVSVKPGPLSLLVPTVLILQKTCTWSAGTGNTTI